MSLRKSMYDINIHGWIGRTDIPLEDLVKSQWRPSWWPGDQWRPNEELKIYEDLVEDLADVTLTDEDTNTIITDDANIPDNMTMQVTPPGL